MKQLDEGFLELYNLYETDADGAAETGGINLDDSRSYRNVLRKAGLARGGRRAARWALPLAAVVAAAGLLAAAAYYRASDAFRGVLDIQPAAEVSEASAGAVPVLDRAGIVLDGAVQSGSVAMSLRAVAGDEHELKVLLDVEDRSGAPLALTQSDGSLSDGHLYLSGFDLIPHGDTGDSWGYGGNNEFIPTGSPSRMTLLLSYSVSDIPVRGETFTVRIDDIMQFATMEGTALEMEPDALYDIVSGFGPASEEAHRLANHSPEYGDGYLLDQDSELVVPLSEDSSLRVTNASVWNGALHLRFSAEEDEEVERLLANAALINEETGEKVEIFASDDPNNDEAKRWSAAFNGFDSVEDLKGFVWYYGEGYGSYPLAEGPWEFTFTVDVEDITIAVNPDADAVWEGYTLRIGRIEIGPLSLAVNYSVDQDTARAMNPEWVWGAQPGDGTSSVWQESDQAVTITMKDGSTLVAAGPGSGWEWWPDGTISTDYTLTYTLTQVIEPEQVVSVTVGDLVIPVGAAE